MKTGSLHTSAGRLVARAPRGLEARAALDLTSAAGATNVAVSHRTIRFDSAASIETLRALLSIEDIFRLVGEIGAVSHKREALGLVTNEARLLPWRRNCAVLPEGTPPDGAGTYVFAVTASFLGKRNFSRFELADAVASAIQRATGWQYYRTEDEGARAAAPRIDIEIRALLEDETLLLASRLSSKPLYKRAHRANELPGALNPVVAHHMVRLAAPRRSLLDPMCGTGTVLFEVMLACGAGLSVAGCDINPAALAASHAVKETFPEVALLRADAGRLPFPDASFDAVVSDLPWGRQTALRGGSAYAALFSELVRVLEDGGRMVLMSEDPEIASALRSVEGVRISESLPISLYGRHPSIFRCEVSR